MYMDVMPNALYARLPRSIKRSPKLEEAGIVYLLPLLRTHDIKESGRTPPRQCIPRGIAHEIETTP